MEYYGNDGATLGLAHADPVPICASFLGIDRPIPPGVGEAIRAWQEVAGSSIGPSYMREFLVCIGASQHWLVACGEFAASARKAAESQAAVNIGLRFIGRIRQNSEFRNVWVMV